MIRRRAGAWVDTAKAAIHRSFTAEYTTGETAGSFSLGVFITMLPTLGTGLIAFVGLAWAFRRVNHAALLASVVVFNPAVKWGVYAASFTLGVALLGPVPGVTPEEVSLAAGPKILTRLLLGNFILAVVAAVPSYVVAYRLIEAYRARDIHVVETVSDAVTSGAVGGAGDGDGTGDGSVSHTGDGSVSHTGADANAGTNTNTNANTTDNEPSATTK